MTASIRDLPLRASARGRFTRSTNSPARGKTQSSTSTSTPTATPCGTEPSSPLTQDCSPSIRQEKHTTSFLSDGNNMEVLVRVKPLDEGAHSLLGRNKCVYAVGSSGLRVDAHPDQQHFTFNHVADCEATQETVFEVAGRPLIPRLFQGCNCSIFAYGQTGSGKSYTITGPIGQHDNKDRGLIPRVLEALFQSLAEQPGIVCKCSLLEVYNENLFDLLDPTTSQVQLRENSKRGVYVEQLIELPIRSATEALEIYSNGIATRRSVETKSSAQSSRSHAVFTIILESTTNTRNSQATEPLSRLSLIDLAGTERQRAATNAERMREVSCINKSLTTLNKIILSLVENQRGRKHHVPYRDSKLTYLLQDSLGGNTKTVFIATVNSASASMAETLSTLRFAHRAKIIRNKVAATPTCSTAASSPTAVLHSSLRTDQHDANSGDLHAEPSTSPTLVRRKGATSSDMESMLMRNSIEPADKLQQIKEYRDRLDMLMSQIQTKLGAGLRLSVQRSCGDGEAATPSDARPSVTDNTWRLEFEVETLRAEVEAQHMLAAETKTALEITQIKLDSQANELHLKEQELMAARSELLEAQELLDDHAADNMHLRSSLVEAEQQLQELSAFREDTLRNHADIQTAFMLLEEAKESLENQLFQETQTVSSLEAQLLQEMRKSTALGERVTTLELEAETYQTALHAMEGRLDNYRIKLAEMESESRFGSYANENSIFGGVAKLSPRKDGNNKTTLLSDVEAAPLSPAETRLNVSS